MLVSRERAASVTVRDLVIVTGAFVGACVGPPGIPEGGGQTAGCAAVGWPPLQPNEPAYSDATDLAKSLADHGVVIECIAPSKLSGWFEGQTGAALYSTRRGKFDALFLPTPREFDGLAIVERQHSDRVLYTFGGRPKPRPSLVLNAARPVYFIKSLNRLILAHDEELAADLGAILTAR